MATAKTVVSVVFAGMVAACSAPQSKALPADASFGQVEREEHGRLSAVVVEDFAEQLFALGESMRTEEEARVTARRSRLSNEATRYKAGIVAGIKDQDDLRRRAVSAAMLGFTGEPSYARVLCEVVLDPAEVEIVKLYASIGLAELSGRIGTSPDRAATMQTIKRMLLPSEFSTNIRLNAVTAFARAYSPALGDTLVPLTELINHPGPNEVRSQALVELAQIGEASALTDIAHVALHDDDPEVRAMAAYALGSISDARAFDALRQAVVHDSNEHVRAQAVYACAAQQPIAPDEVVTLVIDSLSDFDESVRRAAATTAGRLGDERAATALLQSVGDRSNNVRIEAIDALATVLPRAREKEAYPLVRVLEDSDRGVSTSAHRALRKITNQTFERDEKQWREWFYTTYPEDLDPEIIYKDQPRPRYSTSGFNTTGGRRTTGTSASRPTSSSQPNPRPNNRTNPRPPRTSRTSRNN